ncbi:hypothetical protein [Natronobiforma cellulositropha]|uniref:hypothetical protein n=1 Tax=Natronobiforma cellulositropha TaxID=1679076 RepID=UPI0021D5A935|nr:hypothetical protein [Natronobiforma cellulositropha]
MSRAVDVQLDLEADGGVEVEAVDVDSDEPESSDSRQRCPVCHTPLSVVTTVGPLEHYASPCGCRFVSTDF